jgi:hypothetical protein
VQRVGLGLWHETAALEIAFSRLLPPGHAPIEINGRLTLVDNARENVRNGVIRGIRSTNTPQGRISSRLKYLPSIHLYPDPFLLGYKMLFPIFPEPEINLEPGTDVQVELMGAAKLPPELPFVNQIPTLSQDAQLKHGLTGLPERTSTRKGKDADVINIVFAGSRDALLQAFRSAGWQQSKTLSTRAVFHQFYSYFAETSYATAPMSMQFLDGHRQDLAYVKSFQSYEKRNHIRLWKLATDWEGTSLWASAAVRETGATLSIRHKGFIHHVSDDLGEEQKAIVRDLEAADCLDAVGSIARPDMNHLIRNATGEFFRTDGSLLVIKLKTCGGGSQKTDFIEAPRRSRPSWAFRFLRREILTGRSDLWRANCIYAAYDLSRVILGAMHQNSLHRAADAEFRQSSTLVPTAKVPETLSDHRKDAEPDNLILKHAKPELSAPDCCRDTIQLLRRSVGQFQLPRLSPGGLPDASA